MRAAFLCLALLVAAAAGRPQLKALAVDPLGPQTNSLCPGTAMPGGYSPADVSALPETLPDVVTKAFLASNASYQNEPFTSCDSASAPSEACSQVVAGTNYKVRMDLLCSTASNSDLVVTLNATVFYPLPAENKPAQVSELNVESIAPAPTGPNGPATEGNPLCPVVPPGMVGNYQPFTVADLPNDVVELVNTKVANLTSYTTCDWEDLQIPYACSQVVAGANYLMELQLVCSEGNFLGQTTTRMEATVYQPLPYTNQPPELSKFVIDVDV